MQDIDPTDNRGDPFTPGSPPTEPAVKDRSGTYTLVIVAVFAIFAVYITFYR